MKTTGIIILIIILSLNSVFAQDKDESNSNFPILRGKYFGQDPPEMIPEIFAPGIVSVNGRYEYAVSFSPDFNEIFFSAEIKGQNSSVYFSKIEDKKWTFPQKANFTQGEKNGEMEAFVSPDGGKIYFTAYDSMDVKIWYINRFENSWSKAEKLDSPINSDIVFYSNEAANGDIIFTNISERKVYYAQNINGKYSEINEVGIEYGIHGFIAPSQDFILIDALKENDNTKDKDIHVCFKKKDRTWTKPINLGSEVNSNFNETCPSISPDGNYLFFSRYNEEGGLSNIYWVSTEVINKLRNVDIKKRQ